MSGSRHGDRAAPRYIQVPRNDRAPFLFHSIKRGLGLRPKDRHPRPNLAKMVKSMWFFLLGIFNQSQLQENRFLLSIKPESYGIGCGPGPHRPQRSP